jgi:hypothetical protein
MVRDAFQDAIRPAEFIRGTCYCEECLEHNETMEAHTPATISMEELGNAAWDPMCFANDQAFVYYLPGMIRLAFGRDYYIDQLVFHLEAPGRLDALNSRQARAVLQVLWVLLDVRGEDIAANLDEEAIETMIANIEQKLAAREDSSSSVSLDRNPHPAG